MPDHLFAYGTLQPGLAPPQIAPVAQKLRPVGRGFIYGELIELHGYPGAVPDPNSKSKIPGTVLELPGDENILHQLDEYEGYDPEAPETSEFVRVRQTVDLSGGGTLDCWMYRYNRNPKA
jgi:gamma-glutamylcyclotransferase (GGCT)/AIG2-like uncharacterized protein YtfP